MNCIISSMEKLSILWKWGLLYENKNGFWPDLVWWIASWRSPGYPSISFDPSYYLSLSDSERLGDSPTVWRIAAERIETMVLHEWLASLRSAMGGSASVESGQMLSEFATKQIQEAIERKCWNEGYGVIQVNPAYTSQIGRAARNGISELNRNAVLQSVQR